ncbi:MAG: phytanoyl-CoA dioxygenase family protein [Chitinophagales bacterium]|nr:phytanoyl-CoA dioxygenase family protein [Chitinophagales bacterium]
MDQIFRDADLAATFRRDGYITLPLLNEAACEQLQAIYAKLPAIEGDTFFSSSFIKDSAFKKQISDEIAEVLRNSVQKHFHHYRQLGAGFLVKPASPMSVMPIHQDWTIVDEPQFASITIWLPLQDVGVQNGAIKVLPGSHLLSNALRSPSLTDPLEEIRNDIEEDLITLPMKAGEAFVFSHALVHSSHPNLSEKPRIAVAYGMIYDKANMYYYYRQSANDPIEKLSVADDFFLNYPEPGQRPINSQLVEYVSYVEKRVSRATYLQKYPRSESNDGQKKQNGFFAKLKALFG